MPLRLPSPSSPTFATRTGTRGESSRGGAARQAAAASAVATATGLGLNKAPFTGYYLSNSHTGVAYNLAGIVEYQVAPQLFLGGAMAFNNAQNYRQATVSAYLRYMLGNTGRYGGPSSGATLKPVSSPYTPLL